MRSYLLSVALLVAAPVFGLACAKPSPVKENTKAPTSAAAAMPTQEVLREKKPRIPEAAVYVDGKAVAAIHSLELPTQLKLHDSTVGTPRYYMGEYLTALGVDVAKLKAVHFYGGSRVVVVDGDEFRRIQNGIQFSFSRGDGGGKPRLMFAVAKPKVNTTVDMLTAAAVYVDKAPPHLVEHNQVAFDDGQPIVGIPYAGSELSKGTRIYVDGKLTATVKRKELPNGLLVDNDAEHPRFSLTGYLKSIGVDASKAKSVDFLGNDEVILRLDGKTTSAGDLAFSLPRHNQGHIAVPAGNAKAAKVSALQIFIDTKPPARTVVQAQDDVRDDAKNPDQGGNGADDEL